jgi:hypothetical protein
MIIIQGGLIFMGLCYMLLPAFLMHINCAPGTVIDMGSSFLTAYRTFHDR